MLKIIGMITSLCFISIVAISQEAIYFSDVKGEKASSPRLAPKITTVKKNRFTMEQRRLLYLFKKYH